MASYRTSTVSIYTWSTPAQLCLGSHRGSHQLFLGNSIAFFWGQVYRQGYSEQVRFSATGPSFFPSIIAPYFPPSLPPSFPHSLFSLPFLLLLLRFLSYPGIKKGYIHVCCLLLNTVGRLFVAPSFNHSFIF